LCRYQLQLLRVGTMFSITIWNLSKKISQICSCDLRDRSTIRNSVFGNLWSCCCSSSSLSHLRIL